MAYTVPQEKYEGRTQHKSALEAELISLETKLVNTFCQTMLHCMRGLVAYNVTWLHTCDSMHASMSYSS